MPLHVLRHVEPGDRVLVVEQEFGQRLRQLGLADAGRPEEQKRAGRPRRILEPGPRAPHRFRYRAHRFGLADHAFRELLLHVLEPLALGFEHLLDRDAGPARYHRRDVAHADLLALGRDTRFRLGEPLFEVGNDRIGQFAGAAPIAVALRAFQLVPRLIELFLEPAAFGAPRLRGAPRLFHRGLFLLGLDKFRFELLQPFLRCPVGFGAQRLAFDLQLHDAAADRIERLGLRVDRDAHARGRLVNQIDRLVGKAPVADIASAKLHRPDDRRVGDAYAVMQFVAALQPAQDRHRVLGGRLVDRDRLETPGERCVLLDVAAVFVRRRRADAAQLAARQSRLQHVGGVDAAIDAAGADQHVQFVDEDDDAARRGLDFAQYGLQPLLELAAEFGAGQDQR